MNLLWQSKNHIWRNLVSKGNQRAKVNRMGIPIIETFNIYSKYESNMRTVSYRLSYYKG